MPPEISVILVNWNGKRWLQKCLASLASQTYKPVEIIFVDNASTDDSVVFVQQTFPNVKIVQSTTNLGFAQGNNLGIAEARGTYIMLLNTDTWIESDFIAKIHQRYIETGADVLTPQQIGYEETIPASLETSTIDIFGYPSPMHETGSTKHKLFFGGGACLYFSKKLYEETGGLDNDFFMYSEEVDWFWRLHLLRKKIVRAYDLTFHHAEQGSAIKVTQLRYHMFLWRNQNALQMLLKNYRASTLAFILPWYFFQNCAEMFVFFCIGRFRIAFSIP